MHWWLMFYYPGQKRFYRAEMCLVPPTPVDMLHYLAQGDNVFLDRVPRVPLALPQATP